MFASLQAQRKDPVVEGNTLLNQRKYAMAQKVFASGLEADAAYYELYPCLANSMMLQGNYSSADSVLDVLLEEKPNNLAAFWYKGLNYLRWDEDSMSIVFMKKYLVNANPAKHKVADANYYIGRAYEEMLRDTGLLEPELNEMTVYFQNYIDMSQGSPVAIRLKEFLEQVNAQKPEDYKTRWKYEYVPSKKP